MDAQVAPAARTRPEGIIMHGTCKIDACARPALVYGTCDRHTPVGRPRRDGLVVFPGASKP